jgi:hypothetical protein
MSGMILDMARVLAAGGVLFAMFRIVTTIRDDKKSDADILKWFVAAGVGGDRPRCPAACGLRVAPSPPPGSARG